MFLKEIAEKFFLFGDVPSNAVYGEFITSFVVLSYVVACLGSFTGLRFASDIQKTENKKVKRFLHYGGAVSFGAGIWSMHFLGMLAYDMDMAHSYDVSLTVLSMVIAVFSAYGVLSVIKRGEIKLSRIAISSLLLGTAICGMHYTGMAAMQMDAQLLHKPGLFAASAVIAVLASAAALWIVFTLGQHKGVRKTFWQILASLIMGAAICGMHYTGMAASVFIPFADCRFDPEQTFDTLALIVATISSLIFIVALSVSLYYSVDQTKQKKQGYSGNVVFFQLGTLLSVFLILIISSVIVFQRVSNQHKDDSTIINSAGLQRLFLVRYANDVATLMSDDSADVRDEKIEKVRWYRERIEQTFGSFLNGGPVVNTIDGKNIFTMQSFENQSVRRKVMQAQEAWDSLRLYSDLLLSEGGVDKAVKDVTPSDVFAQLDIALLKQDAVVGALQHHFKLENKSLVLKQRIIFSIGIVTFLVSLLYAKFFIANPIESTRRKLKNSKDYLERRVKEQTKDLVFAKEQAEQAQQDAEFSSQAKSDFLANMSHEIRTPMNAVLGMSSLLLETPLEHEQKEFAQAIQTSGENLLLIINDIIDISKIEAGKLTLEKTMFNLHAIIQETFSLYAHQSSEKHIEMILDIDGNLPEYFEGDSTRIKQIFANLINNALKFTSSGYVLVKAQELSEKGDVKEIEFTIKDTGIGIAEDKQGKVFEKFSQAEESTTRKYGGTGLGLTIVSELIALMGGRISVVSDIGKGAKFTFNLFLEPTNKRDSAEIIERAEEKARVLVVDDCFINRDVFEKLFNLSAIEFVMAENAEQALEILENDHGTFDICLTDYKMPGMSGGELLREIRRKEAYSDVAIVIVSAVSEIGSYSKFEENGLNGFVKKPFIPNDIIMLIRALMSSKIKGYDLPFITPSTLKNLSATPKSNGEDEIKQYPNAHVLAVEDMKMNMVIIKKVLKKFGVNIDTAENGLEALNKVKKKQYDIIFMDCQMPEMDGFEATQKIRQHEEQEKIPAVPIVALTADAMTGDREKCLSVGMSDYINKPFKQSDIATALERWLEKLDKVRK